MKTIDYQKNLYFLIVCIVSCFNPLFAQYSLEHYIAPVWVGDGSGSINSSVEVVVTTASTTNVPFTITLPDGTSIYSGTTVSGTPNIHNLGTSASATNPMVSYLGPQSFSVQNTKGIVVQASTPVAVNVRQISATSDQWSLTSKGTTGIGRHFRTGHKHDTRNSASLNSTHAFSVLALESGITNITVDVNGSAIFQDGSGDQVIQLNQGETYTWVALATGVGENEDLNGTLVTSDKNITLTTGSWITWHAGGSGDSGYDQTIPQGAIGSEYIVNYGNTNSGVSYGEVVNAIADVNNTEIWRNGVSLGTINAGQNLRVFFPTAVSGTPMIITFRERGTSTDGINGTPINSYLYQESGGGNAETGLSIIPEVECSGTTDSQFISFGSNATITIFARAGANITINSTAITPSTTVTVGADSYDIYSEMAPAAGQVVQVQGDRLFNVGMMYAPGGTGAFAYYTNFGVDSDGDGVSDCQESIDGTSISDECDRVSSSITLIVTSVGDCDNDGIPNNMDICEGYDDNQDTDGDSVPNGCDFDDDNDGILDVDECTDFFDVSGIASLADSELNPGDSDLILAEDINGDLLGTTVTIEAPTIVSGSASGFSLQNPSSGALRFEDNGGYTVNDSYGTTISFSNEGTLTVIASNAITNSNINQSDRFTLIANSTDPTITWILNSRSDATVTITGNTATVEGSSTAGSAGSSPFVEFSLTTTALVSSVRINHTNNISASGLNSSLLYLNICSDLDRDGIPNDLDLDSDGDGCPDAVEGGDTILNSQLLSSNVPSGNTTGNPTYTGFGGPISSNLTGTYGGASDPISAGFVDSDGRVIRVDGSAPTGTNPVAQTVSESQDDTLYFQCCEIDAPTIAPN